MTDEMEGFDELTGAYNVGDIFAIDVVSMPFVLIMNFAGYARGKKNIEL